MARFAIFFGAVVLRSAVGFAQVGGQDYLSAIADGYQQNRESFRAFKCRWRLSVGRAPSLAHARANDLTSRQSADGLWIVRDDLWRFEMTPAAAPTRLSDEQAVVASGPFLFTKALARDGLFLMHSPTMGSVNISVLDPGTILLTPFDMGIMGSNERGAPNRLIRDATWKCRYAGVYEAGEAQGVLLEASAPQGGNTTHFALDPLRGFLPLSAWNTNQDGSELFRAEVTDFRDCGDDRWFPARSVMAQNTGDDFFVRIIDTLELNLGEPTDNDFAVSVVGPFQVNDGEDPRSAYVVQESKVIGAAEIASMREEALSVALNRADGVQPPMHSSSHYEVVAVAILVGLALLAAAILLWRRRSSIQ